MASLSAMTLLRWLTQHTEGDDDQRQMSAPEIADLGAGDR